MWLSRYGLGVWLVSLFDAIGSVCVCGLGGGWWLVGWVSFLFCGLALDVFVVCVFVVDDVVAG